MQSLESRLALPTLADNGGEKEAYINLTVTSTLQSEVPHMWHAVKHLLVTKFFIFSCCSSITVQMITVYKHCYSDVFQSVEIVDEVPSTDQGAIRGLHLGSVTSQGLMEEEERDVIVIPSGTEPSQMGEMCIFNHNAGLLHCLFCLNISMLMVGLFSKKLNHQHHLSQYL